MIADAASASACRSVQLHDLLGHTADADRPQTILRIIGPKKRAVCVRIAANPARAFVERTRVPIDTFRIAAARPHARALRAKTRFSADRAARTVGHQHVLGLARDAVDRASVVVVLAGFFTTLQIQEDAEPGEQENANMGTLHYAASTQKRREQTYAVNHFLVEHHPRTT